MNLSSFVLSSPYSLFVRSLTSGKFSSSSKDAIPFASSYWYSPRRRRMLAVWVSEFMPSCSIWASVGVSLCSDMLFQ